MFTKTIDAYGRQLSIYMGLANIKHLLKIDMLSKALSIVRLNPIYCQLKRRMTCDVEWVIVTGSVKNRIRD